ncbi:MAG TPA: helix-turn-helix transcriptional regulator [Steroidobacteraceae bacterium]|nr:helix-turn-helix transcriptional regulator [Steroidobacteraceae bacterium]
MDKLPSLGSFEQVLLLAILRVQDRGAYGVSIRHEIEQRTGRSPSPGATYTTLDRLEAKGMVTSCMGESSPERGGRSKRLYRISGQGLAVLRQFRHDYQNMLRGLGSLGEQNA